MISSFVFVDSAGYRYNLNDTSSGLWLIFENSGGQKLNELRPVIGCVDLCVLGTLVSLTKTQDVCQLDRQLQRQWQ